MGDAEAAFVDDGGVDGEGVEGQGVHFLRNLRVDEVGNVVAVAVVQLNDEGVLAALEGQAEHFGLGRNAADVGADGDVLAVEDDAEAISHAEADEDVLVAVGTDGVADVNGLFGTRGDVEGYAPRKPFEGRRSRLGFKGRGVETVIARGIDGDFAPMHRAGLDGERLRSAAGEADVAGNAVKSEGHFVAFIAGGVEKYGTNGGCLGGEVPGHADDAPVGGVIVHAGVSVDGNGIGKGKFSGFQHFVGHYAKVAGEGYFQDGHTAIGLHGGRDNDMEVTTFLAVFHRRAISKKDGGRCLRKNAGEAKSAVRRHFGNEKVKVVAFAGDSSPREGVVEGGGSGAVNGFGITADPSAHAEQGIALKRHHGAVAPGTDVEEVVAPTADDVHEAKELLVDLVGEAAAFLPRAVAPSLVEERCGGLPRGTNLIVGDFVVCHNGEVAPVVAQTPANHALGLEAGDKVIEFLALCGGERTHVEPDFRHGTVAGHDFLDLLHVVAMVLRGHRVGVVRSDAGAGEMPVDEGEVDCKADALALAGFGKLLHGIATERSGVDDVVVGVLRVVHAEAVVVLGSEDDGLHAGSLGKGNDGVGVPMHGVKAGSDCLVVCLGYFGKGLYLFAIAIADGLSVPDAAQLGIQAEVNEHRVFLCQPFGVGFLLCNGDLRHEQECDKE